MQDKKLLQIGEVAKIFHVSMGTLRHYEQAGLLDPEYVDEKTGYRYYGVRQLEVLNTIRYLRVLDLPLSEIAEFLHNRDTQVMEEKLVRQKEIIEKKRQELDIIAGKIDGTASGCSEFRTGSDKNGLHTEMQDRMDERFPEAGIVS